MIEKIHSIPTVLLLLLFLSVPVQALAGDDLAKTEETCHQHAASKDERGDTSIVDPEAFQKGCSLMRYALENPSELTYVKYESGANLRIIARLNVNYMCADFAEEKSVLTGDYYTIEANCKNGADFFSGLLK